MHEKTKFRLHSHDVPYGSGSGQQSVTGFPGVVDSNSYWVPSPLALIVGSFTEDPRGSCFNQIGAPKSKKSLDVKNKTSTSIC